MQKGENPVLGLMSNDELLKKLDFKILNLTLSKGDRLVFFTDGLSDCKNDEGIRLGTRGLFQILQKNCHVPAEIACEETMKSIADYCHGRGFEDDSSIN